MLREIAEYPNSFGPLAGGDERIETGRYTLCVGAGSTWNTVQRQRFPLDQVDEVLAEVRAELRSRGRTQTQWEVGSSAPPGLVDALLERGLVPDKDPYAVALVLTGEPPASAPVFTARRVETLEELEASARVQWEAFGATAQEVEEARRLLPERFRDSPHLRHSVWLDGQIVCTGTATPTEHGLLLYGGATAAHCPGTWCLPCADPGPLGRRGRARDAGADHPGRRDVTSDPRAAGLRGDRRGAHAAGRVLRMNDFTRRRCERHGVACLTKSVVLAIMAL